MNFGILRTARKCSRRVALLVLLASGLSANAQTSAPAIVIDASVAAASPQALSFPVGGPSPTGHRLSANDRYLMLDGSPWFPLMGEFHYARYPESEWEKELLKMKAGGIQVVSTYVFWIYHEELQDEFNWAGQRNLRRFVELCAKHGLYVWLRIGPWNHGEVRNGGLPDWLLAAAPTRENNPVYLDHVRGFYSEIGKQVRGLFWKDGGPIVGIQLENEYSARGPGKGSDHILQLRQIAQEAGLNAPFYTVTGWDNAVIPPRDILPVFGGYADGFWWRSLDELPPTPNYFFTPIRCEENVGDDLRSKNAEIDALDARYPFLTAEMGGGMAVAYHRRPLLTADDTAAMAVTKLGSGVVGYGYYMFHGGTNPDGAKTSLQESQTTGYPNDLPVKSYDFQAPLGEFGQVQTSYHVLRTLHLFLNDFGASLAPMTPYFASPQPENKQDASTARVAARMWQGHGFLFINNHERAQHMPAQKNFQVRIKLASDILQVPRNPTSIPSDAYTIWPLNLDLGPVQLRYATAQLLCRMDEPRMYVFFAWPGIAPEFAFDAKAGNSIESPSGRVVRDQNITYVEGITPGTQVAIRVKTQSGSSIAILVLSREQALNLWKANVGGKERLILSAANLYFAENEIHLAAPDPVSLQAAFFPVMERAPAGFARDKSDGIFEAYSAHIETVSAKAELHQVQDIGPDPPIKMGKEVALAPEDSDFANAARWTVEVSRLASQSAARLFLQVDYEGDVARLYVNGKLLTDNFYNGTPWLIGMDRIAGEQWDKLELKILPLHEHSPFYLPKGAWPSFPPDGQIARVNNVRVLPEYEVVLSVKP